MKKSVKVIDGITCRLLRLLSSKLIDMISISIEVYIDYFRVWYRLLLDVLNREFDSQSELFMTRLQRAEFFNERCKIRAPLAIIRTRMQRRRQLLEWSNL